MVDLMYIYHNYSILFLSNTLYTVRDKTVQIFCEVRIFPECLMNPHSNQFKFCTVVEYHVTKKYQFKLLHNFYFFT